jgi:hypothetical protein
MESAAVNYAKHGQQKVELLYFWLHIDGERTHIRTYYSHGARECDDRLLHSMAEQLKLSKKQFCDLIDCVLSGETYVKTLGNEGYL